MSGGGGNREMPETAQEKALADVASREWNRYQDVYVPLENMWLKDIRPSTADYSNVASEASGAIGLRADQAQAGLQRGLFSQGAAPGSGKFLESTGSLNRERGLSSGRAMTAGTQLVDDSLYQGLGQAVAVGRGQATEAIGGLGDIATRAVNNSVGDRFRKRKAKDDTLSTIGFTGGLMMGGRA